MTDGNCTISKIEQIDTRCHRHAEQKPSSAAYVRWQGTRRYSWLCADCLETHKDKIASIHPVSWGVQHIFQLFEKYPETRSPIVKIIMGEPQEG